MYLTDRDNEVTQATLYSHSSRLGHFVEWCRLNEIENLNTVTGRDLHRYRLWRREEGDLSPITEKTQMDTLRVFVEWLETIDAAPPDLHTRVRSPMLSDKENVRDVMLEPERADAILEYLAKFEYPEWALFFEVPGKHGHRADAIAYNLYPSRNFRTVGFEIKLSRSDWKKELEDGGKADYFVGQCDAWYVVAGRKGIVKESELPEGWGLYGMKAGGKLYKIVESEPTPYQQQPVDREFYMRAVKKALKRERKVKR